MTDIKVRQSQITHTYAAGAIGDFPGASLMFLSHDHEESDWGLTAETSNPGAHITKRRILVDKRLSEAFGIQNFVLPPLEISAPNALKTVRFPMSKYCPSCGTIHFMPDLEKYNNGTVPQKGNSYPIKFDDALRAYYCIDCQNPSPNHKARFVELVPTRFIIANDEGFIADFPWDWYVHKNPKFRDQRGRGNKLKLEFGSSSASLSSITLKSYDKETGKFITSENLGDIFNQETTFIAQDDEYLPYLKDRLSKPWLGRDGDSFVRQLVGSIPPGQIHRNADGEIIGENADLVKRKYPRTLQRGANNLYFPLIFKGIRLPEGLNLVDPQLLNKLTELKNSFIAIQPDTYRSYTSEQWKEHFRNLYSQTPALLIYEKDMYEEVIADLFSEGDNQIADKKQKLRLDEFSCFNNRTITSSKKIWYKARHIAVEDGFLSDTVKIDRITLLDKINELKVFRGFTRIKPLANEDLIFETSTDNLKGRRLDEYTRICDARKYPLKTNELPCSEVKGEGVFLSFNNEALNKWEKEEAVVERYNKMSVNLNNYFETFQIENGQENINARYVFLHTLSHMIMQQLSIDSGYSLSSLTEIIYCNKRNGNQFMNGILIYTSSSDTEGTLGGLVEKGLPQNLTPVISKAIDKAKWCSSDPLCITSNGQGFMTTNMAACYSCVMVPETCCENINKFLDRKLVLNFFGIHSLE
ncbi:MAG: DUF1998 domain-containing protein [Bacteroidales bacterium]|nr:DUF1998 domain-containing protein [Bacteroidales bacterium]